MSATFLFLADLSLLVALCCAGLFGDASRAGYGHAWVWLLTTGVAGALVMIFGFAVALPSWG